MRAGLGRGRYGSLFVLALHGDKKERQNIINRFGGFAGMQISLLYIICLGDNFRSLWPPFIFLGILFFLHTIFCGFIFFKKSMPRFDKFFLYFITFYTLGLLCILLYNKVFS